jgi:hypothetical protein
MRPKRVRVYLALIHRIARFGKSVDSPIDALSARGPTVILIGELLKHQLGTGAKVEWN